LATKLPIASKVDLANIDPYVLEVIYSFYTGRIRRLSLYAAGFGGFFVSRARDGMVIGYEDRSPVLTSLA
jgi:hypothetical protein